MKQDETCEHEDCGVVLADFPDENGEYWCAEHYPEPNGGAFTHLEGIDPEYQAERQSMYNE